jgi:hypothetical protein
MIEGQIRGYWAGFARPIPPSIYSITTAIPKEPYFFLNSSPKTNKRAAGIRIRKPIPQKSQKAIAAMIEATREIMNQMRLFLRQPRKSKNASAKASNEKTIVNRVWVKVSSPLSKDRCILRHFQL